MLDIVLRLNDLVDLTFKFIPKTFHGLFTVAGLLLTAKGFLFNLLENRNLFGANDSSIIGGLFLIEIAIIIYIVTAVSYR